MLKKTQQLDRLPRLNRLNSHKNSKKLRKFKKVKKNSSHQISSSSTNNTLTNTSSTQNDTKKSNSDYLKSKLSRYHTGKHFHKIKFVNPKGLFKRHWCFFIVIVIIFYTMIVHTSTNTYISKLQSDTNELIETIAITTKKVEKLKKKNAELIEEKENLGSTALELESRIQNNENLLNDYINQINDLNKKIEEKTSWTIPTISLYVPINDSYFKTYMDYRKITSKTSEQYKLLHSDKVNYDEDGLIRSVDGDYIGVALGSKYGKVGDKFILTLQSGDGSLHEVKLLKVEEKADKDTTDGYYASHRDLVEFVIDVDKAKSSYPTAIRMGDFNYSDAFNGKITGIKQVIE